VDEGLEILEEAITLGEKGIMPKIKNAT
jgi:hypothetical protein